MRVHQQLAGWRLPLPHVLLNTTRAEREMLDFVGPTEAENLDQELLTDVPSIEANAEAPVWVDAAEVTEFAVPCALDLAVAEAKALVLSPQAFTPTMLPTSDLA
jgi:hypothetical protein